MTTISEYEIIISGNAKYYKLFLKLQYPFTLFLIIVSDAFTCTHVFLQKPVGLIPSFLQAFYLNMSSFPNQHAFKQKEEETNYIFVFFV